MVDAGNQSETVEPPRQAEHRCRLLRRLPPDEGNPAQDQTLESFRARRRQVDRHPPPEGVTDENQPVRHLAQNRFDRAGISGGANRRSRGRGSTKTRKVQRHEGKALQGLGKVRAPPGPAMQCENLRSPGSRGLAEQGPVSEGPQCHRPSINGPQCHCETNPELLNARATTVENTVDGLANRIQAEPRPTGTYCSPTPPALGKPR